jgi:hypothetical protein
MQAMKPAAPFFLLLATLAVCPPASAVPAEVAAPFVAPAGIQHVIVVILENEDAVRALRQPFLSSLARRGALLRNFHAITHPSQPNYIALVAGSTLGVADDGRVDLDDTHLGDLLEARSLDWRVYAEHYPGNCYLGMRALTKKEGQYVRRHVPFLSFRNVQGNPQRCAKIVPAEMLDRDITAGTLPSFALYVPDNRDNGHDTGVEFADRWLRSRFEPLLADPRFTTGTLLVLTFDESRFLGGNRIATLLVGEMIRAGTVSNDYYSHYSLLRTVEEIFGTGTLGRKDAASSPIAGVWQNAAPVSP